MYFVPTIQERSPQFDLEFSGNVTAVLGKQAMLNCRVKDIGNRTVRSSNTNKKDKQSWSAEGRMRRIVLVWTEKKTFPRCAAKEQTSCARVQFLQCCKKGVFYEPCEVFFLFAMPTLCVVQFGEETRPVFS